MSIPKNKTELIDVINLTYQELQTELSNIPETLASQVEWFIQTFGKHLGENLMQTLPVYMEIIDFIAAGTTPQNLIDFIPSEEVKERIADLIHREKTTGLTSEETAELNHCLQLEHLMRLAKSRARCYLKE